MINMGFATLMNSSCCNSTITGNLHEFCKKFQSFNYGTNTHFLNLNFGTRVHGVALKVPKCLKAVEMIDFDERTSASEVRLEIERCYKLIHRLGRGVIYFGSARPSPDHPHYMKAVELSRGIANLLNCTTWTGVGPGLMDAAIKGAMQAGKLVGGFKIEKEAGQWSSTGSHPYLPPDTYITCRFFSARKHGFVDAAMRNNPSDLTAVIALPGGIGTLDEIFEILALIQLQRLGSQFPVPFLLMNYDGYYSKLLQFLQDCDRWGTIAKGEVDPLWKVCETNDEALTFLARFYNLH